MPEISPEKLRNIKSRLESFCCALCGGKRLEIERPDTRTRSIISSWGGFSFEGLVIVCGDCGNSSCYYLKGDLFSEGISPQKKREF